MFGSRTYKVSENRAGINPYSARDQEKMRKASRHEKKIVTARATYTLDKTCLNFPSAKSDTNVLGNILSAVTSILLSSMRVEFPEATRFPYNIYLCSSVVIV